MCCDSEDDLTIMPHPRPFPYPHPGACVLLDCEPHYHPHRPLPNPGPVPPGYGDPVPGGNVGVFVPNDPAQGTGFTPRSCKPLIPPWSGHHGGVDVCTNGRGFVTGYIVHRARPGAVDPFA